MACQVDLSHAARADRVPQLVVSEDEWRTVFTLQNADLKLRQPFIFKKETAEVID